MLPFLDSIRKSELVQISSTNTIFLFYHDEITFPKFLQTSKIFRIQPIKKSKQKKKRTFSCASLGLSLFCLLLWFIQTWFQQPRPFSLQFHQMIIAHRIKVHLNSIFHHGFHTILTRFLYITFRMNFMLLTIVVIFSVILSVVLKPRISFRYLDTVESNLLLGKFNAQRQGSNCIRFRYRIVGFI